MPPMKSPKSRSRSAFPVHAHEIAVQAALLKTLREEQGLSQENLAQQLDQTVAYVKRVEQGARHLKMAELRAYCQALDIELLVFVERWQRQLR